MRGKGSHCCGSAVGLVKGDNSMALRQIRIDDDPILRKKTRKIEEITPRIRELAQDMLDTMYNADGVGLAAPQVGVLKQLVVIDVGDGPLVMINPEIKETEGSVVEEEACLSFPGMFGKVERPERVVAEYTDLEGNQCQVEGTGLVARAICHELDHLAGIVYVDKATDIEVEV